jgi:hypothetical protein
MNRKSQEYEALNSQTKAFDTTELMNSMNDLKFSLSKIMMLLSRNNDLDLVSQPQPALPARSTSLTLVPPGDLRTRRSKKRTSASPADADSKVSANKLLELQTNIADMNRNLLTSLQSLRDDLRSEIIAAVKQTVTDEKSSQIARQKSLESFEV